MNDTQLGQVLIKRDYWFEKTGGSIDMELTVRIDGKPLSLEAGESKHLMAQKWIEAFVPLAISQRFLFDGEMLPELDVTKLNLELRNGLDDILIQADDLHIPLGQPVKVNLRSIDVLHDFYIPQFRAKMDMVPGVVTYYWFTPTRTGDFEILCMEYCGTGHYSMLGRVLVDEQKDYDEWLSEQSTFEEMMASINKTDLIEVALNKKEMK